VRPYTIISDARAEKIAGKWHVSEAKVKEADLHLPTVSTYRIFPTILRELFRVLLLLFVKPIPCATETTAHAPRH
jgi:hypothetical protein